jgi:alkylation response protein AidB-like acyl-CoA dehydrogenase
MGADGWLGISWPKAYGGRGMTPIEQFIFFDESMRAGAPVMPPCTFMAAWSSTSTTRSTATSCGSNK